MRKVDFEELERASGFRHNPHAIALSEPLRSIVPFPEVVNYDWVYSALQGGAFTSEIEAFLSATKVPRADLQSLLAASDWCYPGSTRHKARYLHRVFDPRRVAAEEPDKIKASCSLKS